MNPYRDPSAFALCKKFYEKYYGDAQNRILILGINPGRFGGGVTGIPFTDPVKLEKYCGIRNDLDKRPELSADFMYNMIEKYGGPEIFYKTYFVGAVSPLGFTRAGKNLNFYDLKDLQSGLHDFIVGSIRSQLAFPLCRDYCYCLGEGRNFKYLSTLNRDYAFFNRIIPLPHPRFIMQYRRKKVDAYIRSYMTALREVN